MAVDVLPDFQAFLRDKWEKSDSFITLIVSANLLLPVN